MARKLNWIWYVGAAVWFYNAAFAMRHGWLRSGLIEAAISAAFLAVGQFYRRQTRHPPRNDGRP